MLESHIHLILYAEMYNLFNRFVRVILPFGEFKMKVLLMWDKGGLHSGVVDNALGIIHKDAEGENIPDIGGKTNPSPLFLNQGRKRISIRVADRFVEAETQCRRNMRSSSI